jgi:predicted nucleic acid-binding protein
MAVLDTSFLIDVERRKTRALAAYDRLVDDAVPLLVPAQVAAEYLAGLQDDVAGLHQLEASFAVIPFGRVQLLEAARIARAAFAHGTFAGWADAQVAALAVLEQTFVVSADRAHFEQFGVPCWDYRREANPPRLEQG